MTYDITPGTYKNSTTGIEFEVYVGGDEVIIERDDFEIRKDAGNFWFNVEIGTFELVEDR